jgi:hypothetical protein
MSTEISLKLSLSSSDPVALVTRLSETDWLRFDREKPVELFVDNIPQPIAATWIEQWIPNCRREVFAAWDEAYNQFVQYVKNTIIKAVDSHDSVSIDKATQLLSNLPFTLASFAPLYSEWYAGDSPYLPPSFGDLQFPLGWGCAFQGTGHDRLVSRRWLEFGPWRTIRSANDTTLVQFHELGVDAAIALQQAQLGHERMGISDVGGLIQTDYIYDYDIDGFYDAANRRLEILVHNRQVSQPEMLEACAIRYYQPLGIDRPVDIIAYIFIDENLAHQHLHELWLREIECWTFLENDKVRLDKDYYPTPSKPDWVSQLEER